jgi:peptide/nickel transport system permease protein
MSTRVRVRFQSILAIALALCFIMVAILADVIAPTTGELMNGVQRVGRANDPQPHPPGPEALLGTTPGQMDVFYALVHGTRNALVFGLITTLMTALIGLIVGATGGMRGGWINQLSMRFTDGVLCIPVIAGIAFFQQIINMTVISSFGNTYAFSEKIYIARFIPSLIDMLKQSGEATLLINLDPVMLALIVLCWVPYARTINVLILKSRQLEYVSAARASGANGWRIFWRHILPNVAGPITILITRDIGQMVVWQTTFAFVGYQSNSAWTAPLMVSRSWIVGFGGNPLQYWWVYLPITFAIILFAFTWILLGDEINHWLNPKKDLYIGMN